jgi:peroxiredoxin
MSSPPSHRLDPDRAAAASTRPSPPPEQSSPPAEHPPAAKAQGAIDTSRYRWMIGIFGLALVAVISVWQFASHGTGTAGVPAGQRLHYFAAPLASSTLNGAANVNPPCTEARHDPRALNICLISKRTPLVLAFFVTGSSKCRQQVDTLQAVSGHFEPTRVRFAAVAVGASHAKVAAEVRQHHWTIPVAYDSDGRIGSLYGVQMCPLVELARPGGVVTDRLIGSHWLAPSALAGRVRALVGR